MAVLLWTLLPLALLHLWMWRRASDLLRVQLVIDLVLAAVLGPALVRGAQLNPVRTLARNAPFTGWEWAPETTFQPTQSDLVLQIHPWMDAARRDLLGGRLPLIAERIGGGLPLLANGQTGTWAPVNLPAWVLGVERGTTVMALWKLEAAGIGMYLLLARGWRLRRDAATLGAAAFTGCAYLVAWLIVPMGWVIATLPWAWWGVGASLRRRAGPVVAILLGVALGWLMGAGLNPETSAITVGSALLGGLVLHPGRWLRLSLVGGTATAVTLLLASPTLAYIPASAKYEAMQTGSPPAEVLAPGIRTAAFRQLVVPLANGHPARGDWHGPFPYAPAATGVGGVALAALACGRVRRRQRRRACAVLLSLATAAVLAFRIPPLDGLLVHVPPLDSMTLPRFVVLVLFSLILLAALAVDGAPTRRRRPMVPGAVLVLVVAAVAAWAAPWRLATVDALLVVLTVAAAAATLAVWVARPRLGWLLPWVAAAELALYAVGVNPTAAPRDLLPRPPIVDELIRLQSGEGGRVMGLHGVLPANLAGRYGLPDLRSYDPLRPRPFVRLLAEMGDPDPILGGALDRAPPGLCGAWAVRWLLAPPGVAVPGWERVASDPGGTIHRNPRWLPTVRAVPGTLVLPEEEGPAMSTN